MSFEVHSFAVSSPLGRRDLLIRKGRPRGERVSFAERLSLGFRVVIMITDWKGQWGLVSQSTDNPSKASIVPVLHFLIASPSMIKPPLPIVLPSMDEDR